MQNLNWTLYNITVSVIELYFSKIFTEIIISCNSFKAKIYILNSDCMIILPIVWVKNTVENVD